MTNLGVKIKELRKEHNISQDVLAKYLGVSFQSISKWENQISMPDISLLPSIAAFFKISIDELFGFNEYDTETQALKICDEALIYREANPLKAKEILEKGLQRFPGNELIMNHLLYVLYNAKKYGELIPLCKALIQTTTDMETKYDAEKLLIETYYELDEKRLVKEHIDNIPELYFTKLELIACLTEGPESIIAAVDQKNQSICLAIKMLIKIIDSIDPHEEKDKFYNQFEILKSLIEILQTDKMMPEAPLLDSNQLIDDYNQAKKRFNLQ